MHPFFALGRIRIPAWGTLAALGAAAGLGLCLRLLPKGRRRDGGIVLLWALAGAAVGAKVSYLFTAPGDVPLRLASGFVYYGGLWGGALAAAAAASHRGCPALEITDAASPGLALGHALGRIGCFLAGCCWGIPAPEPWGIALPQALAAPRGVPLLPVPLYEAAGNALLCAGLLLYRKKKPCRTPGSITGLYLSAYAVLRFLLEFLRGDEARGRWGALSAGQWNALAALLVGLWLLVRVVEIEIRLDGASVSAEARLLCGLAALRAGARLYRDEKGKLRAEARVLGKPLTAQQLAAHRQRRKELPGGAVSRALKRLHPEVAALSLRVRIGVPGDAAGTAKLHGLCAALLGLLRAWAERHAARAAHEPFRVQSAADFSRSVWEARGQCILWIKMGNLLSAGLCLAAEALRGRKRRRKKGTYKEAESNGASD